MMMHLLLLVAAFLAGSFFGPMLLGRLGLGRGNG